jgi:hypothetical protein
MSRTSEKTAKRSTKPVTRTAKKTAKGAKSARASDKTAAKSARNPIGTSSMSAAKAPPKMLHTVSPPVQPVASQEISLKSHKYQIGEMVYYTSPTFGRASATGSYTVVKQLPSEGDDYQYRIKSSGEAFERVAKESQLDKL